MYNKPNLEKFFQAHPAQNNLEIALDMIVRSAEDAKDSLESEDEDEFLFHLSEVHSMIESILTSVGTHTQAIKQHYPNGVPSRPRKEKEGHKQHYPSYENPKQDFNRNPYPYRPNYPAGYKSY